MHPCPCCGYKTLPSRGDYELCPVCWWEDDGGEPWEFSGPNGQTLVEGQAEFLADRRPYRRRPGKVRAPRKGEARDPDWRPFDLTDDMRARIERAYESERRFMDEANRRAAEELARNPEGPFKAYNAGVERLKDEAATMTHKEVDARLRDLLAQQGMGFRDSHVESVARLLKDEHYYRRHPLQAAWWFLRYARPGTFKRRWNELRTGTFTFVG